MYRNCRIILLENEQKFCNHDHLKKYKFLFELIGINIMLNLVSDWTKTSYDIANSLQCNRRYNWCNPFTPTTFHFNNQSWKYFFLMIDITLLLCYRIQIGATLRLWPDQKSEQQSTVWSVTRNQVAGFMKEQWNTLLCARYPSSSRSVSETKRSTQWVSSGIWLRTKRGPL